MKITAGHLPTFLAALVLGAVLGVITPSTQAIGQESCRDMLGAERMLKKCRELQRAKQCERALAACQEAASLCPAIPRYTDHLNGLDANCATATSPNKAPPKANLGEACDANTGCQLGLLCSGQVCRSHTNPKDKIAELRASARAIASYSPCDARSLLELACGTAQQSKQSALGQTLRQDLFAARAACRSYSGDHCTVPGHIRGRDGAELVAVPAGTFMRGSDPDSLKHGLSICRETYTAPQECDLSWFQRETPRKEIFVSAFFIDKYEVSNAQYQKCVKDKSCAPIDYSQCNLFQSSTGQWKKGGKPHPNTRKPNHPAVCTSWEGASTYCEWAGKRLPTEAEWEKAARGAEDDREFPWGNSWSGLNLNWGEQSGFGSVDQFETTSPIGHFPQNVSPYGAMDMAGNVWEWTSDYHNDNYYTTSSLRDPVNTQVSSHRVLRGGSWSFAGNGARAAYRYFAEPESRDDAIGFRCARSEP